MKGCWGNTIHNSYTFLRSFKRRKWLSQPRLILLQWHGKGIWFENVWAFIAGAYPQYILLISNLSVLLTLSTIIKFYFHPRTNLKIYLSIASRRATFPINSLVGFFFRASLCESVFFVCRFQLNHFAEIIEFASPHRVEEFSCIKKLAATSS